MKVKSKEFILIVITAIYLVMAKIYFNMDASPNGSFEASSAAYKVALVNIIFIFSVVVLSFYKLKKISTNALLIITFVYYLFALISSLYSQLPLVSAFRALTGLGFYYVVVVILDIYKHHKQEDVMRFVWVILIFSFLSSLIFYIRLYGYHFNFGVPSGYSALIACIVSLYFMFMVKSKTAIIISMALLVFSLYMKSFSALIAWFFMFLFLLWVNRRYYSFIVMVLLIVIPMNTAIIYLGTNPEQMILGKPAGAYLIGSGRFEVYIASFDLYFNQLELFQKIFGVGFMSEREFLKFYDLAWSTDPHNSFIVSLLGLGVPGAILYWIFVFYPFSLLFKRMYRQSKEYMFALSCHLGAVIYGSTSSQYLGTPSILMIVTLLLLTHAQMSCKGKFTVQSV